MTLTLLALIPVLLHSQDARISFESPAAPAQKIIAELAARTGRRLTTDGPIGREVVLVSVHDVSVSDLMKRLAITLHGEWQQSGRDTKLVLTPKIESEEKEAAAADTARRIDASLREAEKNLIADFDQAKAAALAAKLVHLADSGLLTEGERAAQAIPSQRAALRLLLDIPSMDLARLRNRERVVYALAPTKRQRTLSPNAAGIIDDMARDQPVWLRALQQVEPKVNPGTTESEQWPSPLPKVTLVVTGISRNGVSASLYMAGKPGPTFVAQFNSYVFADPPQRPLELKCADGPIQYSQTSKELLAAYEYSMKGTGSGKPPSRELLDRICDPVKFEPLATLPGEALLQLAHAEKRNLVAWLPDTLLGPMYVAGMRDPLTLKRFVAMMADSSGANLTREPDWITAIPYRVAATRVDEATRRPLKELLTTIRRGGPPRLIDVARFAAASDSEELSGFSFILVNILGSQASRLMLNSDWRVLQLYGSLTDDQIRGLLGNGRLSFLSLSERQRRFAEILAYRDFIKSETYTSQYAATQPSEKAVLEPTEALPDGLPATGYLSIPTSSIEAIFGYRQNPDGSYSPVRGMSPAQAAFFIQANQQNTSNVPKNDAYLMGNQALFKLTLNYSDDYFSQFPLVEQIPASGKPGSWEELPPKVVTEIRTLIKAQSARPGENRVPPPFSH